MPRKRFPSDKNTTTIRVFKPMLRKIKKAARKDRRTVSEFTDIILTKGMAVGGTV